MSEWIDSDPQRMGGAPCVRDTRVPVSQIVDLLVDCSDQEIISAYPTVPAGAVAALRAEGGGRRG